MVKKKIKVSDILGDSYYVYELTSSNYTPALNGTVTITCTMKDIYGTAAGSKSITLYQNGTSVSAKTTNSSGVATWSVTCSNAGIQSFKVGNKTIEVFVDNKEDKSNKVTSLSENSTNTQYPSAKTVYDELMNVRTVTPTINDGGSQTINNVTKNGYLSSINSSDLEYFEKIVYNITFKDNDFQMFFQPSPKGSNIQIIYFDGTDCYWGEADDNTGDLTKGSLICEGNTIQATLNKDKTVTIGNTVVNWKIDNEIVMFGNVDFTYTIYSHKYLDNETFPYVFKDQEAYKIFYEDYTYNSITKDYGEYYFDNSYLNNIIETTYTFTFNDNDFSFIEINSDYTIFFDGADCYWGEWDENDYSVLNKGTLICEGNVVQAVHKSTDSSNEVTFPDGTSTNFSNSLNKYFGDVSIKGRIKASKLEYASNKTNVIYASTSENYDEHVVYPTVYAIRSYAEKKSNKTSSWNSTTDNTKYPTEKLVKDSLDGKEDKTNKVTSISPSSTDTQYPSAKAVKSNLDLKLSKQEDSLITVTDSSILSSEYYTKDRWTYEGASGGSITSNGLGSGFQGNAFYTYNFPSSVTSVTMNFFSPMSGNSYITNGEGVEMESINNFSTYTYTATSDEGLGIRIDDANKVVHYAVTSITFNMDNWIDKIYPIGATYISTVEIEPSTLFGGVWEQIKDTFLLATGDTYENGSTGGEATHTLTTDEMPKHTHSPPTWVHFASSNGNTGQYNVTRATANNGNTYVGSAPQTNKDVGYTGRGEAHNNMPPYLTVYMWKRVA